MKTTLSDADIEILKSLSTSEICNAIETFNIRLRNEGYMNNSIVSRLHKPEPMIGYAVTMKMRTEKPPTRGTSYPDRSDWWESLNSLPRPKILVIQDTDPIPGIGSVSGKIHGAIFRRLGCTGIVTNGAVRDLDVLDKLHMHVYSGSLAPSHAYAHIVDVGVPVEIGGLTIKPGTLLHGDGHGIVKIPKKIATEIPAAANNLKRQLRNILSLCDSPDFTIAKLRELVQTHGNKYMEEI